MNWLASPWCRHPLIATIRYGLKVVHNCCWEFFNYIFIFHFLKYLPNVKKAFLLGNCQFIRSHLYVRLCASTRAISYSPCHWLLSCRCQLYSNICLKHRMFFFRLYSRAFSNYQFFFSLYWTASSFSCVLDHSCVFGTEFLPLFLFFFCISSGKRSQN